MDTRQVAQIEGRGGRRGDGADRAHAPPGGRESVDGRPAGRIQDGRLWARHALAGLLAGRRTAASGELRRARGRRGAGRGAQRRPAFGTVCRPTWRPACAGRSAGALAGRPYGRAPIHHRQLPPPLRKHGASALRLHLHRGYRRAGGQGLGARPGFRGHSHAAWRAVHEGRDTDGRKQDPRLHAPVRGAPQMDSGRPDQGCSAPSGPRAEGGPVHVGGGARHRGRGGTAEDSDGQAMRPWIVCWSCSSRRRACGRARWPHWMCATWTSRTI